MKNRTLRLVTLFMVAGIIAFVLNIGVCKKHSHPRSILPLDVQLKTGDIVLRKGSGLNSNIVTMIDDMDDYSHCGIIVDSCGKKLVVHAVPGEPDFDGDVDRVKRETVEKFFSSLNATKGCVLRCKDEVIACKSAQTANRFYLYSTPFDHEYDDSDTTKMYCTELIEYSYRANGLQLTDSTRHNVDLPGLRISRVLLPSDLLRSPHLQHIQEF